MKKPRRRANRGVIATIQELLMKATKRTPITKSEILAELVKRFPERRQAAMKSTVRQQVPSKMRTDSSLDVQAVRQPGERFKAYYVK